jgi:predicted metalloprotease with PDZ domain
LISTIFILVLSLSSVYCQNKASSLKNGVSPSSEPSNKYNVTLDKANQLSVHISADVQIEGDTLFMSPNCPNYDFPEGWSTFIKNLKIRTSKGKLVSYQYISKSKWVVENINSQRLFLDYDVDLSFTKLKWDVGNEQSGFFDGKSVYIVSKALFIFGDTEGSSKINFDLPSEWNLATPWAQESTTTFSVTTLESLLENSLVFGDFYVAKYKEGVFQFTIALLGAAKEDSKLFSSTLSVITKAYVEIFSQTPPTNYLVTMFYDENDDGESFFESFAFTLKNPIDQTNKIIWANQMAHELFHYWNSDLIKAKSRSDRQWFSEGTAEYYANMTLVRQGIISEAVFLSKAEKILGLYQNYRGWRETETSILEAGKKKGLHRFLVYNGGWAVAMALDVEIMENTNGQKNLDDFMGLMFDKYTTNPYSYQDLVNTASEIGGIDLSPFFKKYVEGTELLPLNNYMDRLGYQMSDIIY